MNLDISTRHNQNDLRDKSMPDKLTWMSECEKNILHKVNNARFFINNRNTVSIKNGVQLQLVNEYKANERSYTISEEIKLKMEAEVLSKYTFYSYLYFIIFSVLCRVHNVLICSQ